MKKILFVSSFLFVALFNANADDRYINLVKNSVLDDYKTTTVGNAFDNWDSCIDIAWEHVESKNKTNKVIYSCKYNVNYEKMNKNMNKSPISWFGAIIEFTVDLDDSLSISNVYTYLRGENGKDLGKNTEDSTKDIIAYLNSIYSNENVAKQIDDAMN